MEKSAMRKKTSQPAIIDDDFLHAIVRACDLNRACSHNAGSVGKILNLLAAEKVRQPNDFSFQYTGPVEFRWYDGPGDCFGGSKRWAGLTVSREGFDIRGNVSKEKGYSGESGVKICCLPGADAVEILKILLRIIDAKPSDQVQP